MKSRITKFAVLLLFSLNIISCENKHERLAWAYFESNIADYGIFSQMGIDSLKIMADSVEDSKFEAFTKGASKNCDRKEFMAFVEKAHKSYNDAATKILLEEIEKYFSDEEMAQMAKFYNSFYTPEIKQKIMASFKAADLPTSLKMVASGIGQDKVKEYVAYKNSQLGVKEVMFTVNIPEKLEAHKAKLQAAKLKKPDCIK